MDIHNLTSKEKAEQRKLHMRMDFPYAYGISLGEYKCNRLCRMCPMYTSPPKENRYISDEVMDRALREFGDRKTNVEISAFGETFLHPKADEYLFLTRRLCPNAEIVVATNGTLLDRERCEKIVDSGIDYLSFSLDAGSAESYRWLCGKSDYDVVCRNLETLVEVRNKRNAKHLTIGTHIIAIKELAHEFDAFVQRWSGVVDNAVVRNYGNWAGLVDGNGLTPAERQKVPEERYPCTWLWYATKIEPDGGVSKCFIHVTGDKEPLGNIMEQSFEEIWTGQRLKRLRELHCRDRYDEIEFCPTCMVWSLFPNYWKRRGLLGLSKRKEWR
ncbi:MAG: radical SAM protein [Phycisphaerae bacterium]|nr:radical SAM protein [Phycisphaerae bacterium]